MRNVGALSSAEQQAHVLIRALRAQVAGGDLPERLKDPARLAHYVLATYHGNAALRMSRLAPELGVSLRTLQRSFLALFGMSMKSYQIAVRLKFAKHLLAANPSMKLSVLARMLGYDDPNVFERFFREHSGSSPRAWASENHLSAPSANEGDAE